MDNTTPHVIGYLSIGLLPNLPGYSAKNHNVPALEEHHLKRIQYTAMLVEHLLRSDISRLFVDMEDVGEVLWASGGLERECWTPKKNNGGTRYQDNYTTVLNCITYSPEVAEKYRRRVLGLSAQFNLVERGDVLDRGPRKPEAVPVCNRSDIDRRISNGYLANRLLIPIDSEDNTMVVYHGVHDPVIKYGWEQEDFEYSLSLK